MSLTRLLKAQSQAPQCWNALRNSRGCVTRLSRHLGAKYGNQMHKDRTECCTHYGFHFSITGVSAQRKMATTRERREILERLDCDADLFTSAKLLWFSYSISPCIHFETAEGSCNTVPCCKGYL